jgi:ElaB/YqjD/DUF883 family membrane-anchored ribosome-binding protein
MPEEDPMPERDLQKEFDELKEEFGKLQDDLGRVADRSTTVAKDAAYVAKDAAYVAKDKLEDEAQRLLARLQELGDTLVDKGRDVVADVEKQVEAQPVPSALTALGIGVFLGILLSRR